VAQLRTATLVGLVFATFVLVESAPASAWTVTESFERDMGGWVADSDVPGVPWHITRSTLRAFQGVWSLEYYLNGTRDDGTIWVERSIPANPKTIAQVHIDFWLYSKQRSQVNGWAVVAYAGVANPEREADFTIVGYTDLGTGWFNYHLDTTVPTGVSSTIWVAFGYSVRWEVNRTDYFDYVTVTRTP